MATIDGIVIPSLTLDELTSDPATPAAGTLTLYGKSDGAYIIDDAGTVTGPLGGGGSAAASGARAYKNGAAQSIANGTLTAITFDAENFDTATYHDNVTNNTRITVPTTGYYLIQASINYAANANGLRSVFLKKNGTDYLGGLGNVVAGVSDMRLQTSTVEMLTAGDYVVVEGFQSSGSSLNVDIGRQKTWFAVSMLGT